MKLVTTPLHRRLLADGPDRRFGLRGTGQDPPERGAAFGDAVCEHSAEEAAP